MAIGSKLHGSRPSQWQPKGKNPQGYGRDRRFSIISDDEDDEDDEDNSSVSSGYSSSDDDDEDVDFVKLTKLKRAKAMKAAKNMRKYGKKVPRKVPRKGLSEGLSEGPSEEPSSSASSDALVVTEEPELDDSLVDAVISEEEKKLPELYDYSGADDETSLLDLEFPPTPAPMKHNGTGAGTVQEELDDEDLGEAVEGLSQLNPTNKISDDPVTLEVPKFDDTELNSDADYDFDPDDLIRTLQNDDDELELLGPDGDFGATLGVSSGADNDGEAPFLRQETEAMVKEEEEKEKQKQKEREKREAEEDDVEEEELDLLGYKDLLERANNPNNLYVPQSVIFSEDEDDEDGNEETVLLDGEEDDHESGVADDAEGDGSDSNDDSNLLHYFFSDSESDYDDKKDGSKDTDSEATDEDTSLPQRSTRRIGSKRAKEMLASSKNNFRAPKLGTFVVARNKKPFGIIDGYSTRFLTPRHNKLSILKGTMPSRAASVAAQQQQRQSIVAVANGVELEELLNISEFEEEDDDDEEAAGSGSGNGAEGGERGDDDDGDDDDNEGEGDKSKFQWETFFKKKRVPLTAFRNRGMLNDGAASSYAEATRKYKYSDAPMVRRKHQRRQTQRHRPRRRDVNFEEEFVLTGQQSQPIKMKKGSKRRMRRKSVVEAQAEGFRTTKSGLFNEDVMKDVESVMMDLGATEDYTLLFGE